MTSSGYGIEARLRGFVVIIVRVKAETGDVAVFGILYSSISRGCGFLMWRMLVPCSVGLNGWSAPYGLGMPMSSGMYAFGRGSAVVCVSCCGAVSASTLRAAASLALRSRPCSKRCHSASTSALGGRLLSRLACLG